MSQPVHSVLSPHRQRMALIIASIVGPVCPLCGGAGSVHPVLRLLLLDLRGVSLAVSLFISTRTFKMAYKIAWIIPILLVPLIGGVMYIILGGAASPTTAGQRPAGP